MRNRCRQVCEPPHEVADHGVATAAIVRTGNLLEPARRPDPTFQLFVVPFEAMVQIRRRSMLGLGQPGAHRRGIAPGFAQRAPGRYLGWCRATGSDRLLEEGAGSRGVAPRTQGDVDDLTVRVDRAIEVAPAPTDREVRVIDAPACANSCSMRACRSAESRGCPQGRYCWRIRTGKL